MSRVAIPIISVGNEFVLPRQRVHLASSAVAAEVVVEPVTAAAVSLPAMAEFESRDFTPPADFSTAASESPLQQFIELLHHYSLGAFALLFLLVAAAGIEVGSRYWSAHILATARPAAIVKAAAPTIAGLNLTVPASQLQTKLQSITNQPASLTVGSQTIPVGADTIRGWLQISASADKSQDYIRVRAGTIAASLAQLANQFAKVPVNQVTVNEAGTDQVVIAGQNGATLSDPGSLKTQASQVARSVMDGKGLQFNTPLVAAPFQAVTPANFDKLLVANVTTKQLYAYQNGQLVQTFATTSGAPATPTPIGEFHIWEKLPIQTMTGFNPNGTPYTQPNVPWINYFDHAGDAVHGNYWRPASVFGSVNTSHGCVSVPVDQGEWIYNWAPIGTTVITQA